MTLTQLQTIFPHDNINDETTVGELIDLADALSLEDSRIVEWDQVDTWLESIGRGYLAASILHYLEKE